MTPTTDYARIARYRRLEALDREIVKAKGNKHDRVLMLINACISEGLTGEHHIIGTVAHLGFNHGHVATLLKESVRLEPEWPYWGRDENGRYFAPPMPDAQH